MSDHGSGFIAREFAGVLAENHVTHRLIRPHTPTDKAEIERCQRTLGERIEEQELANFTQAQRVIEAVVRHRDDLSVFPASIQCHYKGGSVHSEAR